MKKVIGGSVLVGGAILLMTVVGSCGWAGFTTLQSLVHNNWDSQSMTGRVFRTCYRNWAIQLLRALDQKTYIVLLQNADELRASGGFMGSYIKITTRPTGLHAMEVRDIYVADGQIKGHVEPPYPIQEAFAQGWWRLRDANWDVDFASASASVAWFLEQGGEGHIDGIVGMHTGTFKKLLEVLGPVYVQTYEEHVSAKNLTILAQKYAEIGFMPGSSQKRDFLGAVGEQLKSRLLDTGYKGMIQLARLLYGELQTGEVVVWMRDHTLQSLFEQVGWSGRVKIDPDRDYLSISESNLGANKANCCVTRTVKQEVQKNVEILTVRWQNSHPFETPRPPQFWGGDYKDYVRIVLPRGIAMEEVRVGGRTLRQATDADFLIPNSARHGVSEELYVVEPRQHYTIVGLWATVPAQQSQVLELRYTGDHIPTAVIVQKQPGMEPFAYERVVNGKVYTSALGQ